MWVSVGAVGCMLVLDLERVRSRSDRLYFFTLRAFLLCVFFLGEVDREGMDERD